MSIWDNQTSEITGDFETGGGDIAPIPNNTNCVAYVKDIGIKEFEGQEYINVQWGVIKPEEYKDRVVFQKIKIFDPDKAKQEKAIMMLAAIDHNAGGKLPKDSDPTDESLIKSISRAIMGIKVMEWEMNDKKGNWISAVSSKTAKPAPAQDPTPHVNLDDDVPF